MDIIDPIAHVEVKYQGKIYDFCLYAMTLIRLNDSLKIEYTEKINGETTCTYLHEYLFCDVESSMLEVANLYKDRICESVKSFKEMVKGELDV